MEELESHIGSDSQTLRIDRRGEGPTRRRFDMRRNISNQTSRNNQRERARQQQRRRRRRKKGEKRSSTNTNNINNASSSRNTNRVSTSTARRRRKEKARTRHQNRNEIQQEDEREDILENEGEAHGDNPVFKASDIFRIGGININSLPNVNTDRRTKNERIKKAINKFQLDAIAIQEPNKNWYYIDENHRWPQRTRHWWEARHNSIAHNTYDISEESFLPGGNIITTINKAAYRVSKAETDPTNLGRWTSTLFKGKNNIRTRLISAYRTCVISSAGENTVHRQQERYLDDHKIDKTPRQALFDDLGSQVDTWITAGEQIVLIMDANTDIRSQEIQTWAQQHGLRENLTDEDHTIIATNSRGSVTIDGIFTSGSIEVLRKGYSEFGAFPTDHRLLWIDIHYKNAFGHKMPPISIPGARRLKSDNIKCRKKWISTYERLALESKLHDDIFRLEQEANGLKPGDEFSASQKNRFNKILQKRHDIIKIADKKCRKLRMNNNPCTPEIDKIKKSIVLYEGALTRKHGAKFSLKYIKRLEKRVNVYNVHMYTEDQLYDRLNKAKKELFEKTKSAREIRDDHYKEKARIKALEDDLDSATVYTTMIARENFRDSNRRIKFARGKLNKTGLTKVEVHTADGIKEITEKEEIERVCMDENDDKYHQTNNTPCLQQPLRELLGRVGETEFAQSILDGTFVAPDNTDPYVIELFKELKRDDRIEGETMKAEITSDMFVTGWKKMKEQTSAGISGLHFGHLKTVTYSKYLTQIESSISHIPFRTGMSPTLWQTGIDVMIHKKAKSENVEDLRTIVLKEADSNMNNKILGREAIRVAEKYNLLPEEQYGSRPGKSAIDHAVHKRIWYDIVRQTRQPAYMISNDAKSNYDRILHTIASLAYKRIGIPDAPVHSMLITIQLMRHYIRTSYGDSITFMNCSGVLIPYQGLLQGNGASPTTWVLVSTPLINMLRSAGNGTHMISPLNKERSHIVAFAFVDDTDIPNAILNGDGATFEYIKEQAQDSVTRWEGGMKATGGAIRPDKSFVYAIDFVFDDNGDWTYKTFDNADTDLEVKDHTGRMCPLENESVEKGLETLGVFLAPDGSNTTHIEQLKKKSEKWAADIKAGHLNPNDAWIAINTTLISSMKYSLPALTLTKLECTQIMRPALTTALNSLNMSKNFPRDLVYGCPEEKGLGILDLWHEQGISQCYYIMKHLQEPSITGRFIRYSLEMATVEMGIRGHIYEYDFKKFKHLLTDTWLKCNWEYTKMNNIDIYQDVIKKRPLLRVNDSFLSEDVINSKLFRPKEIRLFNNCRKYLQVERVSEVFDGFGDRFNTKIFAGEKDPDQPSQINNWPRQQQPGTTAFRVWRRILRKLYMTNNQQNRNLGHWYRDQLPNWKWKIMPTAPFNLYEKRGNRIKLWKAINNRGVIPKRPVYRYHSDTYFLPRTLNYATIIRLEDSKVQVTGHDQITDYDQDIIEIPHWGSPDILKYTTPVTTEIQDKLLAAMAEGQLHIVSDGSYFEEHDIGSAAWRLDDGNETILQGKARCPGEKDWQNPYRSELWGILGGITQLLKALIGRDIIGTIIIGCDGKGALLAIENRFGMIEPNRKHFDIIASIWRLMDTVKTEWSFIHIDSHQDDFIPFANLDRLAQLNVLVDSEAKQICYEAIANNDTEPVFYALPLQKILITIDNKEISSDFKKEIHKHIQKRRTRDYWKKKLELREKDFQHIDWDLLHKSTKNYERPRWLSKWSSGFCGVGVQLVRYGYQKFNNCPRCNAEGETVTHVLKCPQQGARDLWKEKLEELDIWMTEQKIMPELHQHIITELNSWHQSNNEHIPPHTIGMGRVIRHQNRITWKRFVDGFWSTGWRILQQRYMTNIKDKRSALLLMSKTQRKIWHVAWSLWEHRNDILHNEGDKEHKKAVEDQNILVLEEWATGLDTLPQRYAGLFRGTLEEKIALSFQRKQQWLSSVWHARRRVDGFVLFDETNSAVIRYLRWYKRKHPDSDSDN